MKNQNGSIIFALVACLLIAVAAISFYFSTYYEARKINMLKLIYATSLKQLSWSGQDLLKSPLSIVNSVRGAKNKLGADLEKCIYDSNFICPMGSYSFSIYDENNSLYIDTSNPDAGFDIEMAACTGFSSPENFTCVARLDMTWSPDCPVIGPCHQPSILVQGDLKLKDSFSKKFIINLGVLSFLKRIN